MHSLEKTTTETQNFSQVRPTLQFSPGVQLIADERYEQIYKHGRSIEKDIEINTEGQLIGAARLLMYTQEFEKDTFISLAPHRLPGWDMEVFGRMMNKPYQERIVIAAALLAAEIDRLLSLGGKAYHENPLAEFGRKATASDNPHYPVTIGGKKFTEGNYVGGTWVNERGETFYQEGTICYSPANGLMVEDSLSLGVTPLKLFYTMEHKHNPTDLKT